MFFFSPSLLTGMIFLSTAPAAARQTPEEGHDWARVRSRHFIVSYDQSTAHLAPEALAIAEATATTLSEYFGADIGDKTISIVLTDDQDEANGSSYGAVPLVEIWCRKVPLPWRGETYWLETVLSHELSHVYTLMQIQRRIEFTAEIQYHSDPWRADGDAVGVLGPDNLPEWFVEGIAQVGSREFHADFRDPWRETLLRDAYLHGHLLDLSEMARFEGTSRESELAYNQGFDLLDFLRRMRPEVPFKPLCAKIKDKGFRRAFQDAYGESLDEIYDHWKESLAERFHPDAPDSLGPARLPLRRGPFLQEMSTSGNFAIANWEHDYSRFDLFERMGPGWYRIATDVGTKAAFVPSTRTLWYSRWTQNPDKDAQQMELFSRDSNGSEKRETTHARCLAFDASGRSLVYAAYEAGKTEIVRRDLRFGSEAILRAFPFDTAVYGLSMDGENRVFLSLGTGDALRSAVLDTAGLHVLWANGPWTWDAAPWRADTLVFASSVSGSPRLYWASSDSIWHPIHPGTGGILGLRVERGAGDSLALFATVYEDGSQRLRAVDGPWACDTVSTTIPPPDSTVAPRAIGAVASRPASFDLVRYTSVAMLQFSGTHYVDSSQNIRSGSLDVGYQQEFGDPTGSYGFGAMVDIVPSLSVWAWKKLHDATVQLNATGAYMSQTDSSGLVEETDNYTFLEFQAQLSKPIGLYSSFTLSAGYAKEDEDGTLTYGSQSQSFDFGTVYTTGWIGGELAQGRHASKFDPAALGAPGYGLWAEGEGYFTEERRQFGGSLPTWKGSLGLDARGWLGDLASVDCSVDAQAIAGGIRDTSLAPPAYVSMGGSGPFRGYSDEALDLRDWVRGQATLRANPFLSRTLPLDWWDRFRMAAHLEAGRIRYLARNPDRTLAEKEAFAASWDFSLRQAFYLRNTSQSSLEIGIAQPILRLHQGRRDDPYRLFFSLLVQ